MPIHILHLTRNFCKVNFVADHKNLKKKHPHTHWDSTFTPPPTCYSALVPSIDRPACSLKESFLISTGILSLALQAPLFHSERYYGLPVPTTPAASSYLLPPPPASCWIDLRSVESPWRAEPGPAISKDMFEEGRRRQKEIREKAKERTSDSKRISLMF